jgi:uncharacterized protein YegP (UPF0339 family)
MPTHDQELRETTNHEDSELGRSFAKVAKRDAKHFVLFWDFTNGRTQYCWRLRDGTGKTLAFSQRRHTSKQECEADMMSTKMKHPGVAVVDLTKAL